MNSKELFDKIIHLGIGQQIAIPCHSRDQMNSMRVSLGRERRRFLDSGVFDFDILVKSRTTYNNFFVILEKTPPLDAPFIISAEGEITGRLQEQPILTTVPAPVPQAADTEKERLIKTMREDGLSDEEINAYFGEEPTENLSEEMSKIDVSGEEVE